MPAENACPHCGARPAGRSHPAPIDGRAGDVRRRARRRRPTPRRSRSLASGSNDEQLRRDPPRRQDRRRPSPTRSSGEFVTPASSRSEASAAVADRPPGPPRSARRSRAEPRPSRRSTSAAAPGRSPSRPGEDDDDEDEPPDRGRSWASILLASYASADDARPWSGPSGQDRAPRAGRGRRAGRRPRGAPTSAAQAGLSRKVAPPEPILAEHLVDAGQAAPGRLAGGHAAGGPSRGRSRSSGPNLSGKVERTDGGKNALVLRLRLRNTSTDAVFAPLDQAFLRERGKEIVDSFIETGRRRADLSVPAGRRERVVDRRPGVPRAPAGRVAGRRDRLAPPTRPATTAGPFTWRVRLRTGIDRTDVIGVRLARAGRRPTPK